jgi:sulfur carrier protein
LRATRIKTETWNDVQPLSKRSQDLSAGCVPVGVVVNGQPLETAARFLSELVTERAFSGQKVATALNGQFVAEARRATTAINPGDRIEIVSARQGG